jgi:hypothetical protein
MRASKKSIPNPQQVADWANRQRKLYHKGLLSQEKISKLEATPGWSWNQVSQVKKEMM